MEPQAKTKRPNILIFMTDQQNGRTIHNGAWARAITPNIDRFRRRAASFTNAVTPSPHCCPSRTSFFTSLYPSEHGVWNNVNNANALSRGPRPDVTWWSQDFLDAGYDLAFSGKWHVSNHQKPSDLGWRELFLTQAGHGHGLDVFGQHDESISREASRYRGIGRVDRPRGRGEILRPGWTEYVHYGTDEDPFDDRFATERGVEFIQSAASTDAPWMLFVGTLGPHDPYTPPKRFLDLYDPVDIVLPENFEDPMFDKPGLYRRTRDRFDQLTADEHREAIRHYLAFCSYEDHLFGKLLDALDASGQADETVVLYLSDHGDYLGEHGLWGKGLPSFGSAYNVPFVIGGPGIAASRFTRECTYPVTLMDIGPTLLDLCGVTPSGRSSGLSLAPWLIGDATLEEIPRDHFFQSNGNEVYGMQRIVVSGRWKLVHNMFDYDELYDLQEDPGELVNLLAMGKANANLGEDRLMISRIASGRRWKSSIAVYGRSASHIMTKISTTTSSSRMGTTGRL